MTDDEIAAYMAEEPTGPPTLPELVSILFEIRNAAVENSTENSDQDMAGWLIPSDNPIMSRMMRALKRQEAAVEPTPVAP